MKKLWVFVLVVSLLAFASSSFAATYDYDTIDDVVGHWTGTDSDLAGHINSTYGSDAYNKYLAEKAARSATTPPAGAKTAVSSDSTIDVLLDSTTATFTATTTSEEAAMRAALITDSNTQFMPLSLPKITISKDSSLIGKTLAVCVTDSLLAAAASTMNGKQLLLYADGTDTATAVADMGIKLIASGDTAIKTNGTIANKEKFGSSIAARGDIVLMYFVYDPDTPTGGKTIVKGASASDGVLNSGLVVTSGSTPTSLSSSGGGCAVGTSALALAVLGLFIAKRRG